MILLFYGLNERDPAERGKRAIAVGIGGQFYTVGPHGDLPHAICTKEKCVVGVEAVEHEGMWMVEGILEARARDGQGGTSAVEKGI